MPRLGAVARALRRGPRTWLDLIVAVLELARARRRLGRHSARALIELSRRQGRPDKPCSAAAGAVAERVAYAIPRVAERVPWRADCFIQALAAQSWLARSGVASEIWIGVKGGSSASFAAHAWLVCAGRGVTGGDVSDYTPLVTPDTKLRSSLSPEG